MRFEEDFMRFCVLMANDMFLLALSAATKFRTSRPDSETRNSIEELPVLPVRLTFCYEDFDSQLRQF